LKDAHHEQQVPLQDIFLELVDLENTSFQIFEDEIIFLNGSKDASPDTASDDIFGVFWIEPCLLFGGSLFNHCDDLYFKLLIHEYSEVFLEDHDKQVNFALSVTGAIAKLSTSRKSIAMAMKLFASAFKILTDAFALSP